MIDGTFDGVAPISADSEMNRRMVDGSVDPFVVLDANLVITFVSPTIVEVLGWRPDECVGRPISDFLDPDSLTVAADGLLELSATLDDPRWVPAPFRVSLRTTTGTWRPVDVMTRRVHWPGVDGYLAQIHPAGIAQGLADVVRAILDGTSEDDLLTMLPPLLGHEIPGAVATIGAGWDGYRFNRVFGARHLSLGDPSPDDVDAIETVLRTSGVTDLTDVVSTATMARGQAAGHGALWGAPIVTATGDASDTAMFVWHWTEGPPGRIMRRRVERLVDLARLVEGWGSQRRELMWRVAHDALTGLVNRSTFTAALAESGGRARALLYCDLDDFKPVNDEFGHVAGDRVLAVVADRMANAAWGHTVARLSGDEFAVLIDPARDRSEAIGVAEAIRSALAEPVDMADSSSVVGVSIGLAFDPAGAASADVLIDEADRMLRKCKSGGKNCIEVVDLSD